MKAMMKKPVKKYAIGGMTGELPMASAVQQQANAAKVAKVAKQNTMQQQYVQQQRQQQAAAAQAPRARIPAPQPMRGRTQAMMAKGGAVKGKNK